MKIFVVLHEMFDKAGSVAATDNGGGVSWFFANHFGGDGGSGGVGGIFGETEEAIPDDGTSISDGIGDFGGGKRADVEFFTLAVFVKIFGDVDFGVFAGVAVGGDFSTDYDVVGEI